MPPERNDMVPKHRRNESTLEFLETAKVLAGEIIRLATRLPKRYTFYLGQQMCRLAIENLTHLKSANSIYPKNEAEKATRALELKKAYTKLQALSSTLDVTYEVVEEEKIKKTVERVAPIIFKNMNLVKNLIQSDKKRF